MDTRVVSLCIVCEEKSLTESFRRMFSNFGAQLEPATPDSWYISSQQCQGCGTTQTGRRWRHELKSSVSQATVDNPTNSQPEKFFDKQGNPMFSEFDGKLLYVLGVKL